LSIVTVAARNAGVSSELSIVGLSFSTLTLTDFRPAKTALSAAAIVVSAPRICDGACEMEDVIPDRVTSAHTEVVSAPAPRPRCGSRDSTLPSVASLGGATLWGGAPARTGRSAPPAALMLTLGSTCMGASPLC
jgi:hypothetical protein